MTQYVFKTKFVRKLLLWEKRGEKCEFITSNPNNNIKYAFVAVHNVNINYEKKSLTIFYSKKAVSAFTFKNLKSN